MKKRSQTSSISGKQVSTRAFAGEAVHEKYLKHFNPFNESNRDQSNTCIAWRSDFFQPRSGMRSGRKQVTTNTGLQGNYTNELQIRPKKPQHIYMSKQPCIRLRGLLIDLNICTWSNHKNQGVMKNDHSLSICKVTRQLSGLLDLIIHKGVYHVNRLQ